MKVFIVLTDWNWGEGDVGREVKAFPTNKAAMNFVSIETAKFIKENHGLGNNDIIINGSNVSIFEPGRYDTAHISWNIFEETIQ